MPTYTRNTAFGTVVGVRPVLVDAAARILDALVSSTGTSSPSTWTQPSSAIGSQPDFYLHAA